MSNKAIFDKNKYIFIKQFMSERDVKIVDRYLKYRYQNGQWADIGDRAASRLGMYADPLLEALSLEYAPAFSEITGKQLEPTYTFCRIYEQGRELTVHKDRPSCEYSLTINIEGPAWPIYMKYKDNPEYQAVMDKGDAVLYLGCEVDHWRDPLPKGLVFQIMFHYIDVNGSNYPEYRWDRRNFYGKQGKDWKNKGLPGQ